jgi:putative transport protein
MPNFASLLIGNKIFKDFSMDWINDLLWGEGIGHSILLLSFVIAAGIQLGKIKVFGISLGITLVLFVGIILGHFGFTVNHNVIHFFKEFGLILFVYSVGMQVGPGFFSSFRQGGITLNMLACGIVFLGVATALVLRDRYSDAYDGGYFIGGGDEYPRIRCGSAGLFRYVRGF